MAKKALKNPAKTQQENTLTDAEMAERRKELVDFYSKEVELLKVRDEYEQLLTKIEEARFARLQITIAKAQMMAHGEEENTNQEMPVEDEA